jgi:hypothetical protein
MNEPRRATFRVVQGQPHPQAKNTPTCRLCGCELREHEKPEQVCDQCLRANAWR